MNNGNGSNEQLLLEEFSQLFGISNQKTHSDGVQSDLPELSDQLSQLFGISLSKEESPVLPGVKVQSDLSDTSSWVLLDFVASEIEAIGKVLSLFPGRSDWVPHLGSLQQAETYLAELQLVVSDLQKVFKATDSETVDQEIAPPPPVVKTWKDRVMQILLYKIEDLPQILWHQQPQ